MGEGLDLGLADKHLLVTGAGGLGQALVRLALGAGMRVTVVDRDPDSLAAMPATDAVSAIPFDLAEVAGHDELVASCAGSLRTGAVLRADGGRDTTPARPSRDHRG